VDDAEEAINTSLVVKLDNVGDGRSGPLTREAGLWLGAILRKTIVLGYGRGQILLHCRSSPVMMVWRLASQLNASIPARTVSPTLCDVPTGSVLRSSVLLRQPV
jgi:hypothetical protein